MDVDDKTLEKYKVSFNELVLTDLSKSNKSFVLYKYVNIWKSFWDYIKKTAWLTLWIALLAVSLYIAYAFYWVALWITSSSFALVVMLTLFHDVIVASGLYIFTWSFLPRI